MITIRRALISDLDVIGRIALASLEDTYKGVLNTEQIDYLYDLSYSQGSLKNQFDEGQKFFMAALDGEDVGFASLLQEGPELFRMSKIYVDENYQRRGVGRTLLLHMLDEIKKIHPEPCTVELALNRFNESLPFYTKMGFSRVREQITDMGGGFSLTQEVLALTLK